MQATMLCGLHLLCVCYKFSSDMEHDNNYVENLQNANIMDFIFTVLYGVVLLRGWVHRVLRHPLPQNKDQLPLASR